METVLFKGQRVDGKGWAHGFLQDDDKIVIYNILTEDHRYLNYRSPQSFTINPETLCQFTGLTAKCFNEGIDPRIWSGDIFESETIVGKIVKWKVIYKNAAYYVERINGEQLELLSHFLLSYSHTKIGNIHESN